MNDQAKILSTIRAMTSAFNAGDLDGVLRTYEPGAVILGAPDAPVSEPNAVRAMFQGFIAAKAKFTFEGHEVIHAGDIALHLTPWRMTGVGPDGNAISSKGLSIAVLRRQRDGQWLMVIDDPFGDAIVGKSGVSGA